MNLERDQKFSEKTLLDFEKIKRGTVEIIPEEQLLEKLEKSNQEKKPLKVKAGFDPTAPDLHLGHLVLLRKLKHFQDLGHEIQFLIGDFTGMIGDPTGRSATRKRITEKEVIENAKTYEEQVFKILNRDKTKIVFNSVWCKKMNFEDVLGLTARFTVARMVERDDFSKRLAAGESISLIEFIYPLIQGYDSVELGSDIELGGNDQKFNLLVGRELQKEYKKDQQAIVTMPLLVGLDGQKKMSKSFDNYIGITEKPYPMFAKIMSISDELMWNYFILLTDFSESEMEKFKKDPFEAKKILGTTIVNDLHSNNSGEEARKHWEMEKGSSGRNKMVIPPGTPEYIIQEKTPCSISVIKIITDSGLEKSTSAVRRLIDSGAIKIGENLETIHDLDFKLNFPGEYVLRIGKKKYLIVKN
ncbi:MAG: tyrosine--tRNA ligase [Spirochaetia bacterium]|nr:tyrosine--tRNA ligase [Spirochaetia bacterium]